MDNFHYLARGVIVSEGKILVVKADGVDNAFLPGGHIEIGESAEVALVREIKEELGFDSTIKEFLGAVEHHWGDNQFEINLIFRLDVPEISSTLAVASQEEHLKFMWLEPQELIFHKMQPSPVIELILNLDAESRAFWGSTIKGEVQ
ncbi:NUDIX domain-containing protein [Vibrio nitrifigilis]|uniref:NUDIX domain-containing protein n=1 Tax=Vibrio nitrifigilis TaxID=2789781 RepID=A0ABS0GKI6_9VIBR|nr:NUDIX domain-containing protein [Vibrio nitrifigilis]MBF9002947.1 NUDIX domain-containing protein [Vibrio nitrifigilis]